MKEYDSLTLSGQENFLSHASADLVQKMYYENDSKGLEVVIKNLQTVIDRARECLYCLDVLRSEGDVYTKIYLLLEYMSKGGLSEEFVGGLVQLTELATENLARSSGAIPAPEEEREVLKRLSSLMDRHEIVANHEVNGEAKS